MTPKMTINQLIGVEGTDLDKLFEGMNKDQCIKLMGVCHDQYQYKEGIESMLKGQWLLEN